MDAVAEIDHEAFWSGCIKPSQLITFSQNLSGLKIILNEISRMRGKPQQLDNRRWLMLKQKGG